MARHLNQICLRPVAVCRRYQSVPARYCRKWGVSLGAVLALSAAAGEIALIPAPATACAVPAQRLESMALPLAGTELAQFVATDNVAGFYENFSHSYGRGSGYTHREHVVLRDYAVFRDGVLADRRAVTADEQILPYGHRSSANGVRQTLLLHSGRSALAIRVQSEVSAQLAIALLLPAFANASVSETDDAVLIRYPGGVIALSAELPFELDQHGPEWKQARALLEDGAQMPNPNQSSTSASATLALVLRSPAPTRQFTVHVAVAANATAALAQVSELRRHDGWQQTEARLCQRLQTASLVTPDADFNRALLWASHSAQSFVVEAFGTGIWAGLPWFRDNWGRDTFIALPGTLLVTGQFATAEAVLSNFARWQKRGALADPEYGRIPNRVAADDSIIYNTVDGTPWLIREGLEYLRYRGDDGYSQALLALIRDYVRGVEKNWLDQDGLLTHDDADTWMDARIANREAWSPRGNRAVEVQALWFTALDVAATLAERNGHDEEAEHYRLLAQRAQAGLLKHFWDGRRMADRVQANGEADFSLRPNQLMLVSIPFSPLVPDAVQATLTRNAVQGLLLPYGIASLDPRHRNFHPRHENPAFHHKDAAYHNGTIWGWNAGFTITALTRFGEQELAWQLSRELAQQILFYGTCGSMSELVDALPDDTGRITPSGTYAQAWSVAEFVRNAYQDYLGFRPNLLRNELQFVPALPLAWSSVSARLPFGKSESLQLTISQQSGISHWTFVTESVTRDPSIRESITPASMTTDVMRDEAVAVSNVVMDLLDRDGNRQRLRFPLTGKRQQLRWDGQAAMLDGKALTTVQVMASQRQRLAGLDFLQLPPYRPADYSVLRGKDVLQQRILNPDKPAQPEAPAEEQTP